GGGAHPTSRRVCRPSQHGVSARGHDIPAAAKLFNILAEHLAGAPISDVVVEGVATIGDLDRPVAPPAPPEQVRARVGAGKPLTRRQEGWPRSGAGPVASARGRAIARE